MLTSFVLLFHRLKNLNLRGNCISEIPYLLLRGSFKPFTEEFEYGKFSIIVLLYSQSKIFILFHFLHPVFMERNPDERMKRLSQVKALVGLFLELTSFIFSKCMSCYSRCVTGRGTGHFLDPVCHFQDFRSLIYLTTR